MPWNQGVKIVNEFGLQKMAYHVLYKITNGQNFGSIFNYNLQKSKNKKFTSSLKH